MSALSTFPGSSLAKKPSDMKSAVDTISPLLLPVLLPFLFAVGIFQRAHALTGAFLSYHVLECPSPADLESELHGMLLELITLSPIVSLCVILNLAARAFNLVPVNSMEASGAHIKSAPELNIVAVSPINPSATMIGPMSDPEDTEFTASVHLIGKPATPKSASKFLCSSLLPESGCNYPASFTPVESIESDVVVTDFPSEDEDDDYEPDSNSDSDAYEYDSNYESEVEDDIVEETTDSMLRLDTSSNISQESDNESENSSVGIAPSPATSPEPMSDSELPSKGFILKSQDDANKVGPQASTSSFSFGPQEEVKKVGFQVPTSSFSFTLQDDANKVGSQIPITSFSFASQDQGKKVPPQVPISSSLAPQDEVKKLGFQAPTSPWTFASQAKGKKIGLHAPTSSFTFSCDDGPKKSAFQLPPPVATFSFSSKFQDMIKLEAEKKKEKNRKRAELRKAAKNKNVPEVPEPKSVDITPEVANAILRALAAPGVVNGSDEVFNEDAIRAEARSVDIEVVLAELKGRDVEVAEEKVMRLAKAHIDEQKLGAKKAKEQLRKKEQRKKNRAAKKATKEEAATKEE